MKKLIIGFLLIQTQLFAQSSLLKDFQTPPNTAKPRVWWHWMNGNISKDGIQKDLDWMSRVGIGGFQNFDASLFTPVVVPKKIVFMTPEWKDAFKFTTDLANQKGLEMAIAGSPGWSVTGGPWVEPKDAMKKYVWTETLIEAGKTFSGILPQPSDVTGVFQNVEIANAGFTGGFIGTKPKFYQDALVIAYRLPKNEQSIIALNPKVSSSGGSFTLKDLTDGDLTNTQFLPPAKVGEPIWIQYEFETPQTMKAFHLAGANHIAMEDFNGGPLNRSLEASDDGVNFKQIATMSGSIVPQNTVSFPATKAKFFRLVYKTLETEISVFAMLSGQKPEPPKPMGVDIAEFVLHTTTKIDRLEDKAGFTPWREDTKSATNLTSNGGNLGEDAIANADVIDLTSKMKADGTLEWLAPTLEAGGAWSIIRFGYSLTGRQNHPASPEATGLEVDKLDKEAVRKYINTYLDMYKDATGGLMGEKGLSHMILDSYEAGHMTWTKDFPNEFQKRRGYSILNWLPVLTGRIIKSVEDSEKFLWDFRKTIGEMIAENHYDVIGEELHKRGMKRYTESHEDKRIYLADGMDVKRNADIPMSAMWTPGSLAAGNDEEVRSEGDIRESASVANIYGKPIVAAESMTALLNGFAYSPERLKRTADLEMASGLNRFVIHTSVHQPLDDKKPGFSLGPFGQYFTRHETWAENGAKSWLDYLGRSSYMLQQGRNVADILCLYGENTNITWITREKLPKVPAGFEFDFVNSTALINAIEAKSGKLVAQSGNSYSALLLDESTKYMTLSVLKKIQSLVNAGARLVGKRPLKSPSLSDNDSEFQKIANEIWANIGVLETFDSPPRQQPAASMLEEMPTPFPILPKPDVIISNTINKILFRHRIVPPSGAEGADLYWLNNRSDNATEATISFRTSGKIPELWNAQTGKTESVSYQIKDGRTIVPLKFQAWDAYFIVFKDKAIKKQMTVLAKKETVLSTISTPWKLNVANKSIEMNKLVSLTENQDADIKYFAGTASYENTFQVSAIDILAQYSIDLGDVKNIAELIVNGKNIGIAWKKPFVFDISEAIQAGENTIQVKVTNLWPNRLIGDAQPGVTNKTTFTTMPFYQANSPLFPSGLMGEVKLILIK
jgi:alpha-L-rhamnosidase/Glycosyl hydrolases family 2, sugar binding domain